MKFFKFTLAAFVALAVDVTADATDAVLEGTTGTEVVDDPILVDEPATTGLKVISENDHAGLVVINDAN